MDDEFASISYFKKAAFQMWIGCSLQSTARSENFDCNQESLNEYNKGGLNIVVGEPILFNPCLPQKFVPLLTFHRVNHHDAASWISQHDPAMMHSIQVIT